MPFLVYFDGEPRPFALPPRSEAAVRRIEGVQPAKAISAGTNRAPSGPRAAYQRQQQGATTPRPALRVGDLMSSPVETLRPDASLDDARRLFQERGFRHVPVLTLDGKLAGMLSDRDLIREEERPAWVMHRMSKRVLTTSADALIRDASRAMLTEQISALPVVDEQGAIVGIVTTADILRCLVNEAPLDMWV